MDVSLRKQNFVYGHTYHLTRVPVVRGVQTRRQLHRDTMLMAGSVLIAKEILMILDTLAS